MVFVLGGGRGAEAEQEFEGIMNKRMSEAAKARWQDPELRERMIAGMRKGAKAMKELNGFDKAMLSIRNSRALRGNKNARKQDV
jgi:hypothetical protein